MSIGNWTVYKNKIEFFRKKIIIPEFYAPTLTIHVEKLWITMLIRNKHSIYSERIANCSFLSQ